MASEWKTIFGKLRAATMYSLHQAWQLIFGCWDGIYKLFKEPSIDSKESFPQTMWSETVYVNL